MGNFSRIRLIPGLILFLHEQKGEQGLLKLQAIHQVKDPEKIQSCESRQRFSRHGKFASRKSKFKNPAKFHYFFNFSKKSRDNFVRWRLKVNSILTSLAFCYQFFSSFRLHFISWGFSIFLLSRAQHQAFSVKFCRVSWMRGQHEVETKWHQFVLT